MPRTKDRRTRTRRVIESVFKVAFRKDWVTRVSFLKTAPVERREIDLPILNAGQPDLRIAFIADLHVGETTPAALLKEAFARVAEFRPDVLLLGGDYVFLHATREKMRFLTELVASIDAPAKFAVMGNHDYWTKAERITGALEKAGGQMLVNESQMLSPPHGNVTIVGLDDTRTGHPDGDRTMEGVPADQIVVGVSHAPDGLLHLGGRVDLLLAGHTHRGQVAPFGRVIIVPRGKLSRKYCHGTFQEGRTLMYVSGGIGNVEVPLRHRSPPDFAAITLRAAP